MDGLDGDTAILKELNDQDKRIEVCRNFSKNKIIDKLSDLHMLSKNFDQMSRKEEGKKVGLPTLAICIVWIGLYINPDASYHQECLRKVNPRS